jgi:gliding motility-associated-like protein
VYYPFYKKHVTIEEIAKQTYYYEMHIYNRWGQLVFETEDYKLGWTGTEHNGNPADDGTYFYVLKYKSNCGTKADLVTRKGFIQLLR